MSTGIMIIRSYREAVETQLGKQIKKGSVYGTVIYIPPECKIDFEVQPYPPVDKKSNCCPRVLLVSTWTDAKLGFPGGGIKRKNSETPVDAMNREFLEEIGTSVDFTESDFRFAEEGNNTMTYVFAQKTTDEAYFNNLLMNFHSPRKAFVNEILSVCGYPVWVEGPESTGDVCWNNNIWGLPRHLTCQGGCLTPTLNGGNAPRKHFLLLLLECEVVSLPLMQRIFSLAGYFDKDSDSRPLEGGWAAFAQACGLDAMPSSQTPTPAKKSRYR
jgi:8-oxo-dGTP pyrophosphatase MutT (NUDIX family)